MAGVLTDAAATIVTCVHGTWARGSRWPELERAVSDALRDSGRRIEVRYFEWSGRNSLRDRIHAAANLRRLLLHDVRCTPATTHIVVAHSHGANIVLHALADVDPDVVEALAGIVFLSPPLLTSELVENPAGVANRLLLGAIAITPVLMLTWLWSVVAMPVDPIAARLSAVALAAAWLAIFRPAKVRRRAEKLASELALPRIEFPGLIIRAPGDEATAALSSIAAFQHVARLVRSQILDARSFDDGADRRIRSARSWRELARALWEVWLLVSLTFTLSRYLYGAASQRRWAMAMALFPIALVYVTAALTTIGGAMLLLLLLPASSFLLWPFGIFPTAAAALLSVSIESAPGSSWEVIEVPQDGAREREWIHSTYRNEAALRALGEYVSRLAVGIGNQESGIRAGLGMR